MSQSRFRFIKLHGFILAACFGLTCGCAIASGIQAQDANVTLPPPEVVNSVQSIEVVEASSDHSKDDWSTFKVTLKNTSEKNIDTVWFVTVSSGTRTSGALTWSYNVKRAPVIKAGEVIERKIRVGNGGESGDKRKITITTALFEDGSYEGSVGPVLHEMGVRAGYRIQTGRVIPIMEKALEDCGANGDIFDLLGQVKEQLSALGVEADQATIDEIMEKFTVSGDGAKSSISESIKVGLTLIRNNELLNIPTDIADKSILQSWLKGRIAGLKIIANNQR